MKKTILLLAFLSISVLIIAQSPAAFKYQAVARDVTGAVLPNKSVSLRINIIQGTVTGAIVYTERHYTTTNPFGLVNLEIGKGTIDTGSIAGINWGADRHFINIEMDPNGGNAFQFMGDGELLSVPYALHAKTVEIDQVVDADADPANEIQELQLSGTLLTLTKGGGTVTLPSTGGGDNWGTQVVLTDATLTGNGTPAALLKIADNGITSVNILDGTVALADLADNSINSTKITDGSIVTADLANSTVSTDKLGNLAVTAEKLGNSAVTTDKVANGAVTGAKIAQSGATSGQVMTWNGTTWAPATGGGGGDNWGTQAVVSNASYFTGNGTTAAPLSLSSMGASSGQVLKYNGSSWDNAADDNGPWSEDATNIYNSSSKSFGIGINRPSHKLTVAEGGTSAYMNIQNSSTSFSSTDGMLLGMEGLNGWVTTYEAGKLYLGVNGASKMTIEPDGQVGIGTTSPGYKLDVTGPANLQRGIASGIALRVNGDEAIWYNGTYFSWGYGGSYNYFGDKIFIGTTAADPGTHLLVVNGTAAKPGGGSWSTWSDSQLKDIHGNYFKGLKEIIRLHPVTYSYKKGNQVNLPDDKEYVGLVAQEVQQVFPEAVSDGGDGYLQLDINPVNIALINAIKELKAENDNLKARLEKLEKQINAEAKK